MKAGLQVIAAVNALLITTTIASGEDPALPAQCAALLPMMQQQMMQAMQSGMGKTAGMAEGSMTQAGDMPAMTESSDAGKAYMDAMKKMDPSMMEGVQAKDPDVAFIKGMIPHHQGAIDVAKVVLQYGKDEKVKDLANRIVKAQETEIAEMQAWLKQHGE